MQYSQSGSIRACRRMSSLRIRGIKKILPKGINSNVLYCYKYLGEPVFRFWRRRSYQSTTTPRWSIRYHRPRHPLLITVLCEEESAAPKHGRGSALHITRSLPFFFALFPSFEKHTQCTMAWSERQQIALAVVPKVSSLFSRFGYVWILVEVLTGNHKPTPKCKHPYHRLLLGMSVYDILESVWNFASTWAIQMAQKVCGIQRGPRQRARRKDSS